MKLNASASGKSCEIFSGWIDASAISAFELKKKITISVSVQDETRIVIKIVFVSEV